MEFIINYERPLSGNHWSYPFRCRLNVEPIANDIVEAIINYQHDERLKWYPDKSVRLLIGAVLPKDSAVKRTLEYRRKKLKVKIDEQLLGEHGWHKIKMNLYKKPNDSIRVFRYAFKGQRI